jgi:hypothetical protein
MFVLRVAGSRLADLWKRRGRHTHPQRPPASPCPPSEGEAKVRRGYADKMLRPLRDYDDKGGAA